MAAIGYLISTLCYAFLTILLIRVLFSWVSKDEDHPIYRTAYAVTEPVMGPIRDRLSPRATAGLDLSPVIVAFAVLILIALSRALG